MGIGSVEWLINYEAFYGNFEVPAIAAGFTIAVALAVAAASHEDGTVWKQREYYFGEYRRHHQKLWKLLWIGFITLAVFGAFVFVGWNRYSWVMTMLQQISGSSGGILGVSGPEINVTQKVIMSVIGNALVWIVGVWVAYVVHDTNPEFIAALRRQQKAAKTYQKFRKMIEREIDTETAKIDKQKKEKANVATSKDREVGPIRTMRDKINEHENELATEATHIINHRLDEYRYAFTSTALANDGGPNLNRGGKPITTQDYEKLEIKYSRAHPEDDG